MSHFKTFENVEKKFITKPGKIVLEEVFEIKKADPYSVVLTNELNLSRNKTYVLEFDYWSDLEGLTLFTDLGTIGTSIKTVFTKRRVQRAKMELCYDSPNMLSSYLRFYSHNEGSIYISNIRLYNKGAAESSSYLSSKDILIQTRDFDTMENALKGPLLRPDTQLAVEGFTIQKASPYSLILTSAINLKPNTDYVIEFEYWADAEGLTLFTDLATVSPPYQIVIAKKEVQKAYIVFNYDDPNLMNMHVRFYSHNEGNIYVSNIIMYEKQRLGEQPTGEYNPFRYAGEYTDLGSGNYYLRNRYYNPRIGRFLTEDPHWNTSNIIYGDNPSKNNPMPDVRAVRQSINLYAYCSNNPVMFTDPSGCIIKISGSDNERNEILNNIRSITNIPVGMNDDGIVIYASGPVQSGKTNGDTIIGSLMDSEETITVNYHKQIETAAFTLGTKTIAYNPNLALIAHTYDNENNIYAKETMPDYIVLAHEFIHAYNYINDMLESGSSINEYSWDGKDFKQKMPNEEMSTIGLGSNTHIINENSIRAENGLKARKGSVIEVKFKDFLK